MIPVPLSALLAGILAVVLALGVTGWKAYETGTANQLAVDQDAIKQQKIDAAAALATETKRVTDLSAQLAKTVSQQEVKDGQNSDAIDDLSGQLRRAVAAGGLRDPNARRGPCSSGSPGAVARTAGAGQGDGAQADGVLSAELTGLLQRLTAEADTVNNAYASCRSDRWALQQQVNGQTANGTPR